MRWDIHVHFIVTLIFVMLLTTDSYKQSRLIATLVEDPAAILQQQHSHQYYYY